LKVGKTTPVRSEGRIKELVAGHPSFHPEEAQCAALVPMGGEGRATAILDRAARGVLPKVVKRRAQ